MSKLDPIWNVKSTVVELIVAPTAEGAQKILRDRLSAAGLTEHLDTDTQDVFESEPLDADTETSVRSES
jgi:hypothetical protein